jgi:hypothetical protein
MPLAISWRGHKNKGINRKWFGAAVLYKNIQNI